MSVCAASVHGIVNAPTRDEEHQRHHPDCHEAFEGNSLAIQDWVFDMPVPEIEEAGAVKKKDCQVANHTQLIEVASSLNRFCIH